MVRASCDDCGDVEVGTALVQLDMCPDPEVSTYSFQCPGCGMRVSRPAPDRVVETLLGAGVRLVQWEWPAELTEIRTGPPVNHDDLLEFHFTLADDEALARWLRPSPLSAD